MPNWTAIEIVYIPAGVTMLLDQDVYVRFWVVEGCTLHLRLSPECEAADAVWHLEHVDEAAGDLPAFQITLTSSKQPITIRQLLSSQVSRVVMIPGIVISSSKVKAKCIGTTRSAAAS